jgi:SAM-dependent methyltransferase
MPGNRPPIEDLPRIAAEAYDLSARLCGDCRNQHALWTYLRLSRASTGAEKQDSKLEAQLRDFFSGGRSDILIAGAQDTGLLALAARAGAGYRLNITVLDICDTPLELCRQLAGQWSLPIKTVRQDLFDLDVEQRFDVVLVHGTLNFIAAGRHAEVLRRLQRSVRPDGRMALLFNTSRSVAADLAAENHADYADFVLTELKRLGIPLPDREPVMRERLIARARQREQRDRQFADPDEVVSLANAAGFDVVSCVPTSGELAKPADALLAKFSKRRFMLIAEPKSVASSRG